MSPVAWIMIILLISIVAGWSSIWYILKAKQKKIEQDKLQKTPNKNDQHHNEADIIEVITEVGHNLKQSKDKNKT